MKRDRCYILSDNSRRLYVGFTDRLLRGLIEHKQKLFHTLSPRDIFFDMFARYEEYGWV